MARETFENWIPTSMGDQVIMAAMQTSAVEAVGRPEVMMTPVKDVPRSGDFDVAVVAKGTAYGENGATNDKVTLTALKIGGVARVAEEDLTDTATGERTLTIKQQMATLNLAKFFDNSSLGTSAAGNGTTVPFTSLYKALTTNDTATGYTANANRKTLSAANLATGGSAAYSPFNDTLGLYEDSIYFSEPDTVVIASPVFKKLLRGVLDTTGRPIWVQGSGGSFDTLFGYRAVWSVGARVSAVATSVPTGNPLMFVGNRQLLINGQARLSPRIAAGNPGFMIQRADNGVGFLTDEALVKAAMRRAYATGDPRAFAVLEYTG